MKHRFMKFDMVYWTDPDAITSGIYQVNEVKGEVLFLINECGSEVEAFAHECKSITTTNHETI